LFAVVFVIPWLDSIAGLLLITMPVIGLGAWIAAGSERISYAGVQLVFTFALAVLERFGPTTDMTEIRDRLVGILLGVILAGAIQTLVWPEGEGGALRRKLAELLRSVATLMRSDAATAAPLAYAQQQMRAWTDFGTTQAMLARVAIEPDWREDTNELLTVRAQAVLASTRELIRADEALHAQLAVEEPEPQARAAADTARAAVADELEQYAAGLQAEPPSARKPPVAPAMMPQAAAGAAPDLLRHLDGLPDWTGRAPAPEPVSAPAPS
jgi:multidrug resistance protein MdtO